MTRNVEMLTNISYKYVDTVTFDENSKRYVIGQGDVASVGISNSPFNFKC